MPDRVFEFDSNDVSSDSGEPDVRAVALAGECRDVRLAGRDRSEFEVLVEGIPTNAVLDSGAQVDVISSAIVKRLPVEPFESATRLRGYTREVQTHTQKVNIRVCLNGVETSVSAVVNESESEELLLCRSTLRRLRLVWDFDQDRLCTRAMNGRLMAVRLNEPLQMPSDLSAAVKAKFPRLCDGRVNPVPQLLVPFELKQGAATVRQRFYNLSAQKEEWAVRKIKELMEIGVVEESESPFASQCVIVKKENGGFRLTQDFRALNAQTELDPYPFPSIDCIINAFGGMKSFSKIDLKDGFWQVGLTPETVRYTAFVLPCGHFQLTRLPQGWRNSPPKFQRIMNKVLGELVQSGRVFVYIDDIIVGAETDQENWRLTLEVLDWLDRHGLRISVDKCEFAVSAVVFLGRKIDGYTKTTKQESIDRLKGMRKPFDQHTVRCFTGLTGHFRTYIDRYGDLVRPLDELKRKDVPFVWTDRCEESYQRLVELITSNPVLCVPSRRLDFELSADASYYGTGAVLYQTYLERPRGQQKCVIGYQSHTFTRPERNYTVTEKEALAVITAVKYFRTFLDGRRFRVFTDHEALTQIVRHTEPRNRLARWQLFLQSFDLVICHRPGTQMADADALSRLCPDVPVEMVRRLSVAASLECSGGRYLVPAGCVVEILRMYHDDPKSGGHSGEKRTMHRIAQRFRWPGMRSDVARYVQSCERCQLIKAKYQPRPDRLYLPQQSAVPFEALHVDFAELKKKSQSTKRTQSFIVVVDEATRYCFAPPMGEKAADVVRYLSEMQELRSCKKFVSDNGPAFRSGDLEKWLSERGIAWQPTSIYHPAGNQTNKHGK